MGLLFFFSHAHALCLHLSVNWHPHPLSCHILVRLFSFPSYSLLLFILLQNSMQSFLGCWIPAAAAIFIFLVATPQMESFHTFHHHQHHHNRFSRPPTKSLSYKDPSRHRRNDPHSPLRPDEIDPRFGIDKRQVPGGPNPLHNWPYPYFLRWVSHTPESRSINLSLTLSLLKQLQQITWSCSWSISARLSTIKEQRNQI